MEKTQKQCKKVTLVRGAYGFGFTLRHFVVYPGEQQKDIDHKPLETIFVQSVNKGSPAEKFGLQEGDRILSINGRSVSGVDYKNVVELVKLSAEKVDLLLVSKKEDILQMAYPASFLPSKPRLDPVARKQLIEERPYQEPPGYYKKQHNSQPRKNQCANKNNSNRIEFAKFQQNYYDTLDSAYGTGESSYNTVDSSYTQHATSDYGSLGNKWKEPKKSKEPLSAQQRLYPGSAFKVVVPNSQKFRYADEVEGSDSDSDTATETETDTETPKLSQEFYTQDEENMSYVPDYVRPMPMSPVSVSTVTSPTASFTTSRPVQTLTLTSPSTSVSSSNITSPTSSVKDVSFGEEVLSPRGTSLYKRSPRNTSYAGYREDYVRKQKDILCGKKSLEERMKSLESGAAVKLQVSKGSQKRRRRTDASSGEVTPSQPPENSPFNDTPRSPNHHESPFRKDVQLEPAPSKPPQPDIIESNQPRTLASDQSLQNVSDDEINPPSDNKMINNIHLTQPQLNDNQISDQSQINPVLDIPETNRKLEPVSIRWNVASPPTRRKNSLKLTEDLIEEPVKEVEDNLLTSEPPTDPQPARKFGWRKPSADALNRMKDAKEELETEPIPLVQEPVEETNTATVVDAPPTPPPKPELPKVQMRSPSKEAALQRSGAPPPLILDVTTDNAVVPVELRSPRGEGGAFPRANMRAKRNARVFMLPSSDDSEADNMLSNIKMSVDQKPVHVAPVKFVPSVLRNRSRDPNKDFSSSTSSSVTDVASSGRDVGDTPSTTPSMDRKETSKRKSSRSPKRTTTKSHSSRSRSAHGPPQPSHKHSRQMSSDSQPSSASDRITKQQQSSNTKSRSNPTRSGTKQPSSPRTRSKYNDEYEELTNTRRTTPRSMRKFQEMTNLPSPRQQAVAHAVKFGFPGNEGVIPYIDDAAGPDEQQKSSQHHHRSASAGNTADPEVIRRALPLSRGSKRGRMRRRRSRSPNRRTSYMEAMESSEDLTPDPDTDGSSYSIVRTSSGKDYRLSKFGRSNSADSILSTVEPIQKVVMRRVKRSNSADRNSIKAIHRRSYQIATSANTAATPDQDQLRTPVHKRQPSIRKLKNFFGESGGERTPQIVEAQVDEGRRGSRARFIQPVPTLELNEYDDTVIREGFLFFKVATIEKGKRTSSQKLWKTIWVVLKEQMLYLCKDWRTKQETSAPVMNGSPHNTSGSQPPSQLILEEEEPLNIQGSLVSIAYNYTKRRNVFKVTTGIGSEYLFQAEDRDDMLAWINSIQVSGNHDNEDGEVIINEDLILRKTNQHESGPKPDKKTGRKSRSPKTVRRPQVPIKDFDGSRRFKWRGSVNRIVRKFGQGQTLMQGQTFDVHLEDCPPSPNNECVPYVVELCCRVVEDRGLNFMGIYRVPGNSGTLTALQDELNCKGPDNIDFDADERFLELNVISSLLKSFFRKLPDPLFTNELYDDFIAMNRKKDSEERLNGLRRLIHMLPAPHYETLKFLVAHLKRVSDNADVNKMEVRNLAIVFGPTLVRSTISDNMATMVTDMSDQCRIVESVLQHAEWFFTESKDEGEAKAELLPPPPVEEHHEPVPNINHLLANVGRTPGDESDSTESSKSKNSLASEKESFSRDVMDMLLGVRKRWLNNQGTRKDGGSESDDEYGFKEAERRQARAAVERKMKSDDCTDEQVNIQPSSYQVAKAAASELRAAQASKDQHLPHDIQNRLYDFYVEHLERLARTEMSRLPPQFTSSSETSPQVTPRHSNIYVPPPVVQRPLRRSSDSADPRAGKEHPNPKRQLSSPPSSPPQNLRRVHKGPVLYGDSPLNRRYTKHPVGHDFRAALATSTPMHGESTKRPAVPKRGNMSELSSISREDVRVHESESDSDTSIYVGDTLEEKLKNLTNLDKKLERRPSRRYAKPDAVEHPWGGKNGNMPGAPTKGKLLTAPSHHAGEPVPVGLKKSTRELYQERRAMRQQQREQVKASRGTGKPSRREANSAMTRCASDENVFSRGDPKRQHIRSPVAQEEKQNRRPSTDRVRRRHTLGGNDFPGQDFWAKADQDEFHGSLQNVSATSRLKPRVLQKPDRAPVPWRVDLTSLRTKHKQNTKKSESYI
uniref:Rho GTPase-activating protein 21 n=1 Tax=Phallusia mammillata TaxID=59560 RepID=A0A6F9D647_9ASCI|nr:rho GTPase-activating protein 21 [Phallusia mammillata]